MANPNIKNDPKMSKIKTWGGWIKNLKYQTEERP